jgi:hypothetical protein
VLGDEVLGIRGEIRRFQDDIDHLGKTGVVGIEILGEQSQEQIFKVCLCL